MSDLHDELEKEAKDLEKQSKEELNNKNYELAILLLLDAKDIYLELGFTGQVGIIEKQITQIKILNDKQKDKDIYKSSLRIRKTREHEIKLRKFEEKKKEDEELISLANRALEEAKSLLDNNQFDEAKVLYKDSIDIFTELGWSQQVDILSKEIENINKYKEEYQEKMGKKLEIRKKAKDHYEKRAESIITEKMMKQEVIFTKLGALSPEMAKNLEKTKMIKEKAEKEEQMNKFQRALGRYEYILELYKTIPKDKIDLTSNIEEIEKKIIELKEKLSP